MFNGSTVRRSPFFQARTLVAYGLGYALAAAGVGLGLWLRAVPWLAFGAWLAASLTVLLLDKAAAERTPHRGHAGEERLGALFRGSRAAFTVISLLALAALLIALFGYW